MRQRSVRDHALGALILGLFAAAWFGWGQIAPPKGWSIVLTFGSIASILIAIPGGILGWKHRSGPTALDPDTGQTRYNIIFGAEIIIILIGNIVLGRIGYSEWIPAWTCFVVGIHLFPLAPLFRERLYAFAGAILIGVTAAALIVGETSSIEPGFITGLGAGVVLSLTALHDLLHSVLMAWNST